MYKYNKYKYIQYIILSTELWMHYDIVVTIVIDTQHAKLQ